MSLLVARKDVRIRVPLRLSTRDGAEDWVVVVISGEIDLSSAERAEQYLTEVIDAGHHRLAVDLRELAFMDSTGLGVLLRAYKRLEERDGDMFIACSEGLVRRVLAASGMDKRVHVQDDITPVPPS